MQDAKAGEKNSILYKKRKLFLCKKEAIIVVKSTIFVFTSQQKANYSEKRIIKNGVLGR
jgi:hypothetical protein